MRFLYITAWITYLSWIILSFIYYYSEPRVDENYRLAAAISLGLYLVILFIFLFRKRLKPTLSSILAKETPKCPIIGPFLASHSVGHIRVTIGLPHEKHTVLRCTIVDPVGKTSAVESPISHGSYNTFIFDFNGLAVKGTYKYYFEDISHNKLNMNGLLPEWCCFECPSKIDEDDSFILMSCHNPFEIKKGSADEGWERWKFLIELLEKTPTIRFMILGGDQVYNDDVEVEVFGILKDIDQVQRRFIRQYQLFWEDINYRRVMARIPTLAMWDDHDITDGWGCRPESFTPDKKINENWMKYFRAAKGAFAAYQSPRNPNPLHSDSFTFLQDFGENRFYVMDLRSCRNSKEKMLLTDGNKKALFDSFKNIPSEIKQVFVVSPVVAFRTNFEEDKRLGFISSLLFNLSSWIDKSWIRIIALSHGWKLVLGFGIILPFVYKGAFSYAIGGISLILVGLIMGLLNAIIHMPELPRLSDDLDDGLTSECNMAFCKELIRSLFDLARTKNIKVVLLSGDIHLAGISEVVHTLDGDDSSIIQVVASPISYQPMPKPAEGFSTTTSEMILSNDSKDRLFARNVFYTSKRNFARIFPGRLKAGAHSIYFYFEGHKVPLSMPSVFLPQ